MRRCVAEWSIMVLSWGRPTLLSSPAPTQANRPAPLAFHAEDAGQARDLGAASAPPASRVARSRQSRCLGASGPDPGIRQHRVRLRRGHLATRWLVRRIPRYRAWEGSCERWSDGCAVKKAGLDNSRAHRERSSAAEFILALADFWGEGLPMRPSFPQNPSLGFEQVTGFVLPGA